MGIFSVPVKMKNWQNRFLPLEKQGREVSCDVLVDSGAAELALPAELIELLKLEELGPCAWLLRMAASTHAASWAWSSSKCRDGYVRSEPLNCRVELNRC